LQKSALVNYFA